MKRGIRFGILCFSVIIACTLIAGRKANAATQKTTTAKSSDLAVKEDGYLYYKTGKMGKDYALVAQKIGSKKKTILTKKHVNEFFVNKGYVYFVLPSSQTSKNSLYRVKRDGTGFQCVTTAWQLDLIGIQENYAYYKYYTNYSKTKIASVKLIGKTFSKKLLKETATSYNYCNPVLSNNHIYYTNTSGTKIYSLSLGGKSCYELVKGTSVTKLVAGEDGLYYISRSISGYCKDLYRTVYKASFRGKVTQIDSIDQEAVCDYREQSTGERGSINEFFDVNLWAVEGDTVYYSLTDDASFQILIAAKTDGSEEKTVAVDERKITKSRYVSGLSRLIHTEDGLLVAFGGEEAPASYYYMNKSGAVCIQLQSVSIELVDGEVYYCTKGKGAEYLHCPLKKLIV